MIFYLVQIRGIALLELAVRESLLPCTLFPASTRLLAISTPSTSAPSLAAGNAVVPSPQPRSKTFSPGEIPNPLTSASPLSLMVSAMRVKSPFSQSALFGFMGVSLSFDHENCDVWNVCTGDRLAPHLSAVQIIYMKRVRYSTFPGRPSLSLCEEDERDGKRGQATFPVPITLDFDGSGFICSLRLTGWTGWTWRRATIWNGGQLSVVLSGPSPISPTPAHM